VEGDVLYALSSDGDLACLETAAGKARWRKSLRADFGGKPGKWAYSESPLIDGDVLVVTPGGAEATLVALNKKTGAVIWKSAVPGGDPAAYSSAIAIEAAGHKQYVQFLDKGVVGVDAKTGQFLWRYAKTSTGPANIPTPVFQDGYVYSSNARRFGGGLVQLHASGEGVICASAHLGPISLVGQILVARGYRVTMPLETERDDMQRAINRARRGLGLEFIPIESALGLRRVLREGKVLGFLADRAVTGTGERVPFFGREALLPSAHVAFAMRSGAALVPAFAHRDGNVVSASFEPPLEIPRTGDRDADLRQGVRRWAEVLERYVRRAPEQWAVFEKVWE